MGFFAVLTVILTWPAAWHFFTSVPSMGSDTMQVIGVSGERANFLKEQGFFRGTLELAKRSEFNIVTLYAYFFLVFGRIAGYNILFFLSFILSGLGAYLLAFHFTKNKPASLVAGIVFAFSPFHVHNSLSTNVGTMHQEWLPYFALYLFRFFDDLKFKNFTLTGIFLLLIAFTEHQLLAFSAIFVLFFLIYKLIVRPKAYMRPKLWLYALGSVLVLSVLFFFMFRSLITIANSGDNYLDAGLKAAVKYSNDSLSPLVPANFHSFWPNALSNIRSKFERNLDSSFSTYAGYSVLLLTLVGVFGFRYFKKRDLPAKGIFFWLAVAVGFYVLSLGPYLHYKGVLDPPVKMPYYLVYMYLPYYNNIRTVGRLFIWSMLSLSLLAAWGMAYLQSILQKRAQNPRPALRTRPALGGKDRNFGNATTNEENSSSGWALDKKSMILYSFVSLVIILEFLAVPLKTNTLLHSSFYEKLGQDSENYSILEIPGNTDYDFASRSLVWRSIHKKQTVNGYDFARVNEESYTFQRGTPIIRTLLYDIPDGADEQGDKDMMKNTYYKISNEILNYYNIRYVILDHEGLRGDPAKGDIDQYYSARGYIENVVKCSNVYEDQYLYACEVDRSAAPRDMFIAMDYTNKHWVGKDKGKDGLRRWAENGAGVKIVNMTQVPQDSKFDFSLKLYKPLRIKAFLNGEVIYDKYISQISEKASVSVDARGILPGENDVTFGVYTADGSEVHSDKKSEVVTVYGVDVE